MILITGGTGYIGPQLIHHLKNDPELKDHKIVIFDSLRGRFDFFNNPDKSHKIFQNLKKEFPEIELVIGDIRYNTSSLRELVHQADYVFHLAAITGAGRSDDDKKLYWETIFNGTMNIFEAAKETDLEKIVNISSCNIYGRSPEKDLDEKSEINPINAYAKAKASAESFISDQASVEGVPAVSLRLATNFGSQTPEFGGTRYNLVVNKFVKQAMENKPLTPYGDGKNWRPYLHVFDSARMIKEVGKTDIEAGAVFNAGFSDMNFRINEVARKVKDEVRRQADVEAKINYKREKDPGPSYKVDFSSIENEIKLEKRFDLEKGIRGLVEHYETGTEEVREKWSP